MCSVLSFKIWGTANGALQSQVKTWWNLLLKKKQRQYHQWKRPAHWCLTFCCCFNISTRHLLSIVCSEFIKRHKKHKRDWIITSTKEVGFSYVSAGCLVGQQESTIATNQISTKLWWRTCLALTLYTFGADQDEGMDPVMFSYFNIAKKGILLKE